ncbi:LysR family transcriptional regulator [Tardibacter chloracetimidivorans]|uniref:LysR family transcriptional regulator n=1 Tax=Tardibacter chloracetimidivorans TaxID=1921510 RepID=A0A1L3ZVN5_9SPHN|nr:LysR substrate-binding domain-containing protein [Tardibacter chloracetimidivorans]API59692.1 LysR family transcriptional regulator [Tardibacter chloracetimidivorans]
MDVRQLRSFIAVAAEENIGRAAKRLNISQPPLSRQIQALERELGSILFRRTVKGVELTDVGLTMLSDAQNVIALLDRMTERAKRAQRGQLGRLDIGIFGSTILGVVPAVLERFHAEAPDVKLVVHTMTRQEQMEGLRNGRIGVGFNRFANNEPGIVVETVRREPVMVALRADHRLAERKEISFLDLANEPLILFPAGERMNFVDLVLGLFHAAGVKPVIAQEVGDAIAALSLIASGFGLALIAESATMLSASGVVYRNLDAQLPPMVDLSCLYREDNTSPIIRRFLEVVREVARGDGDHDAAR